MKKFFSSHPDITLAAIAFVLIVVLIGLFTWGIDDVISAVQQSTGAPGSGTQQGYNLQGAANLNLPSSTPPAVINQPTVLATSTTPTSTKR